MSKYRYQVSVFVICLSMILSVSVVRGLLVPVPSTIYPDLSPTATQPYILEVPFGYADYWIHKYSNGSYYAVNGTNGDRFYVGSDSVTLLQTCIDACPVGGRIVVDGNVVFAVEETGIRINKPLSLESFGLGTVQVSSTVGATFTFHHDVEVLHVAFVNGSSLEGVTVKGFRFIYDGADRAVFPVIGLSDVSYSSFENLYVNMNGANSTVIYVYGNNSYCVGDRFDFCTIRGFDTGIAIDFEASVVGVFSNCNYVTRCRLWNGGIAVALGGRAGLNGENDYNFFTDNVYDTTTVYAIYDNGTGNDFAGGTFMDISTGSTYYQGSGAIYAKVSHIGGILSGDGWTNVTDVYGDLWVGACPPDGLP